jgi:tRNA dimethylallyltransferase
VGAEAQRPATAGLPPAIALMGPTASGKTALAVELARRFPVDIISVDSALVYRGMDIGTAKPDAATLALAPHRLIDIREPEQPYSAAEFCADAQREMAAITAAGRIPLLVGGTMLYFRALLQGLSELPAADPDTRAGLEQRLADEGLPALHAELAERDPVAAGRINPNDPQRITRALEVLELTGRPMTELQQGGAVTALPYRVFKLVVCPAQRAELHRRIALRFEQMLAQGFAEELRELAARPGFSLDLPAMRAVGYRQGWGWLNGEYDAGQWREKALAATRQLAKRQITWLRREQGASWHDLDEAGAVAGLLEKVNVFLETDVDRSQFMQDAGQ